MKTSSKISTLIYSILIILTLIIFFEFHNARLFPITNVAVAGNYQHINTDSVKRIVLPLTQKGFFGVNIQTMQKQLEQLAWIASVEVSRAWPNSLVITINEKQPVAVWNDNSLLLASGKIFTPEDKEVPGDLPRFQSFEGSQLMVLDAYQKIIPILSSIGLKLTNIRLLSSGDWEVTLDNKTVVQLGKNNIVGKMQEYAKVYEQDIVKRKQNPAYVDMRYHNGLAIRWH
ncbi:MAG: cell division protein FtsQ/DivIB [Gammaproteobacteria bacterium]